MKTDIRRLSYGITPPPNPRHLDEWIYIADSTNGINWRFIYNANSTSIYKWEFIGGSPATNYASPDESTASASAVELSTQIRITLSRAGDYFCGFGGRIYNATAAGNGCRLMLYLNTGGLQETIIISAPAANYHVESSKQMRITGVAAGDILMHKYLADAGTAHFAERFLNVIPIRVA